MSPSPTVIYPLTLPGLLHFVITTQADTCSTLLVICSSRDLFLHHLAGLLEERQGDEGLAGLQNLMAPTLHNLFTTRRIKLAFCASVQILIAYLTAYGPPGTAPDGSANRERLILVNPLALHASTPSFSAQGLSRVFATAAEVALKTGVDLHVVECEGKGVGHGQCGEEDDADMVTGSDETRDEVELQDPWEQEVSILNISARRFGSGPGERAWAGRTVKAKRIAARWFRFHKLDVGPTHEDQG